MTASVTIVSMTWRRFRQALVNESVAMLLSVAGARSGSAPPEEQQGWKRSCRHHGREDQRSWSSCNWRGNCPKLSAPISSRNRLIASALPSWALPSLSTPLSRCRTYSAPFPLEFWINLGVFEIDEIDLQVGDLNRERRPRKIGTE
ncbi:hypothetical protein GH714_001893 [Hevea brasiliensis]|uniref:Uncharacterized protein n=1 Tax=Hevea brasiliensis TaxID=3981 RepID=A0A6A6M6W3_HEVBR|nr:hypothetical protein GH714_001893 [Hevea brasiliensis]